MSLVSNVSSTWMMCPACAAGYKAELISTSVAAMPALRFMHVMITRQFAQQFRLNCDKVWVSQLHEAVVQTSGPCQMIALANLLQLCSIEHASKKDGFGCSYCLQNESLSFFLPAYVQLVQVRLMSLHNCALRETHREYPGYSTSRLRHK